MQIPTGLKSVLLKEAFIRDNRVSSLESEANKVERLSFEINGKEKSREYFREAYRLRVEADKLRHQPTVLCGQAYYALGNEVYLVLNQNEEPSQ